MGLYEDIKKLPKDQLAQLSDEVLELYLKILEKETEIEEVKLQNALREQEIQTGKRVEAEQRLADIKEDNEILLKKHGWWGITDEEFAWLSAPGNYKKYFPFFDPSLSLIKERYAKVHQKEVDTSVDDKFKGKEFFKVQNAWIERSGKYHPVGGFAEHNKWAAEYLTTRYKPEELKRLKSGGTFQKEYSDVLEDLGWIRVMKWPDLLPKFIFPKNITKSQVRTVEAYVRLHEIEIPEGLYK